MKRSSAGARLRAWRLSANLTLKAVAEGAGAKSPSLACEWEKGSRVPSYGCALGIERLTDGALPVEVWGFDRETARRAEPTRRAA